MNGPGPEQEGAALVVEPNEDFSFVLEALEELKVNGSYQSRLLAISANQAFERVRLQLSEQAALIDRLTRERGALETTIKRMTGAGEKALEELHAPKLTVKLEPEKPPVAEKEG